MVVSLIRSSRSLIRPFRPTASCTLDLSSIDLEPSLSFNVRMLLVFKHGLEPGKVIREALSKALVPYYPLAGRLKQSSEGQLQIECSGQGAWFVEASTNCDLNAVNYLLDETFISYNELCPDYVIETDQYATPLVQMQVTEFTCGGYVIGFQFHHTVCDGVGAGHFLKAVGKLARGLEHPSTSPVWCRSLIPTLPRPRSPAGNHATWSPPTPNYRLEVAHIDIPMDKIGYLKKQFQEATGQTCTTFEIVAATFWKCRTMAINLKQNTQVELHFSANCRHLLNPPLPQGFYGNCIFPVAITATSQTLAQASTVDIIKLIQQGKANIPTEITKCLQGEKPFTPSINFNKLFLTDWTRLGFNEVDCGWGHPMQVVPVQSSSIVPFGLSALGSSSLPRKGIRLMTWCVEESHRQAFIDHMMNAE